MTKRPSILSRIFSRIAGRKPAKPEPPKPAPAKGKRRTESSFEPLEGRIAPAILLNASTVQFKDADGDLVTVKFSKGLFTPGLGLDAMLDRVFKFDTGNARTAGNTDTAQVLQTLDLTGVAPSLFDLDKSITNGVSVSITAEPVNGQGDGLVNVGYVKASQSALNGLTLGTVIIEGDLGRIDAGTSSRATAMKSLVVNSLGLLGSTTQAAGGDLTSTIIGAVGSVKVNTSVKDVIFTIENGNVVNGKRLPGNLGSLFIGGKLSVTQNLALVDAGSFVVDGNIGKVTVGTTPSDGIFGGTSQGSGRIQADGKIGSAVIRGDIRGSAGANSGQLAGVGGIGDVMLQFSLFAGSGENSGRIVASQGSLGKISLHAIRGEVAIDDGGDSGDGAGAISAATGIKSVTVLGGSSDGNIRGGVGDNSGTVTTSTGNIGKVAISGNLVGGAGFRSGRVFAGEDISAATVGNVTGGTGGESGVLRAGNDLGTTFVKSLTGGTGTESGVIRAGGDLKSLTIDQVITGGTGTESGSVRAGNLASLLVKNSGSLADAIVAGTGLRSGYVVTTATAGKIILNGSLNGSTVGAKEAAGSIFIGTNLGSLTVTKSLNGGPAEANGSVIVNGNAKSISIGENLTGAAGNYSGAIWIAGSASSISVAGDLAGGGGLASAAIYVGTTAGDAKSIVVGGSVTGSSGVNSGLINATGVITKVTIGDGIAGGVGGGSGGIFGERGLGTVSVTGNVAGSDGLASGSIRAGGIAKAITITGSVTGAVGVQSGSIRITDFGTIAGTLTSLKLGALIGGPGNDSGQIFADGSIASATLTQATGAAGLRTGSIIAGFGNLAAAEGLIKLGGIASLKMTGIQAAAGAESGSILAGGTLKNVTISGAVTGSTISAGRVIESLTANSLQGAGIYAIGQAVQTKTDVAIAKLTVLGGVSGSEVLAGYDRFGNAINGDAQIGSVKVTGNWVGSSIIAGVLDVSDNGFGSVDDAVISGSNAAIFSKIASVIIGGTVTERGDATTGFVAQQIDFMSIAGAKVALTTAKDIIDLPSTLNEITIREVA